MLFVRTPLGVAFFLKNQPGSFPDVFLIDPSTKREH